MKQVPRQQFETALGKMIIEMSQLEHFIRVAISTIVKLEVHLALSMLAGEHLLALINMLESVFPYAIKKRKSEEIKNATPEFNAFIIRLREVNETRNRYVHTMWDITNSPIAHTSKFVRGRKGEKGKLNEATINLDELNGFVKEIDNIWRELFMFLKENDFVLQAEEERP